MEGRIISVKERDKPENPHSDVGDLVIDRLLLRYLSSRVSHTGRNEMVLAYLIVNYSFTKPFDESRDFSGITPLIYKPSNFSFFQQFPGSLLNLSKYAAKTFGKGGRGEQSASAPGQLFASPGLLGISIDGCCGDILSESIQLGLKSLNLDLDVFGLLPSCVLVVQESGPLDRYLVMLDKCIHSAKGRLEGREPVSGLFCNIEENLCNICDLLLLHWEAPIDQRTNPTEGVESTHVGFD